MVILNIKTLGECILNNKIVGIGELYNYEFAFISVWSPTNLLKDGKRKKGNKLL